MWQEGGQVLGFIWALDLGFRACLSELIVKRAERRLGIGSKLVERIHQELSARGCAVLIVNVRRDAEQFHNSHGWSEADMKLLWKRLETKPGQELNKSNGV